ncbi:MAG: RidA family protein [Planctomycetes bacterium]|nr:RidA family protein [Planctomycetota bacterium]
MTHEDRLKQLGLTLPPAPAPVGAYVPYVRVGNLVFTSGQLPMRDGKLTAAGKVGRDLSIDQAAEAARVAVLNAVAQAAAAAGGINGITRIVRLGVFVNSADGFADQPKVANGASGLLVDILGEAGRHARSAVGVNELPLNAAVEIEMIAEVR